jgi:non-ribosomal peptide synthetase component F
MLRQLNSTDDFPLTDNTIHYEIVQRAYDHPQKISITLDAQCLSYAELLHASQYLAHHLIDVCQVKRHDIVTQCVNRSIEMVIGIMAILMTGATYCPLSPDQPVKRLHSLIAQTQSVCTLIHSATKPFELSNYVEIDKILLLSDQKQVSIENTACANDIAYAIFTSGSTGIPKCVPITHHDFTTYIRTFRYLNVLTENDTVLQVSAVTFDIHLEVIMGTLLLGGQMVLLQHSADRDLSYIISIVKNSQITYLAGTPTLLAELAETLRANEGEDASLPTIRYMVLGGKRKTKFTTSFNAVFPF